VIPGSYQGIASAMPQEHEPDVKRLQPLGLRLQRLKPILELDAGGTPEGVP